MKEIITGNEALLEVLNNNGISVICDSKMRMVVSDEDANKIDDIVAKEAPAAVNDYFVAQIRKFAKIKTYPGNASLMVEGEGYDISWYDLEFDSVEEYDKWIEESVSPALDCQNYKDVKLSLEIATDHLRPY